MSTAYSALVSSNLYSPSLNSAIFDGPIRIYFSQSQESLAMKLYFSLQSEASGELARARNISKTSNRHLIVLMYPSEHFFEMVSEEFEHHLLGMALTRIREDDILGLSSQIADQSLSQVVKCICQTFNSWESFVEVSL